MNKKVTTRNFKRTDIVKIYNENTDTFKKEKFVAKHYFITERIHIDLLKVSLHTNLNLSAMVRIALIEYINKQLNKK